MSNGEKNSEVDENEDLAFNLMGLHSFDSDGELHKM